MSPDSNLSRQRARDAGKHVPSGSRGIRGKRGRPCKEREPEPEAKPKKVVRKYFKVHVWLAGPLRGGHPVHNAFIMPGAMKLAEFVRRHRDEFQCSEEGDYTLLVEDPRGHADYSFVPGAPPEAATETPLWKADLKTRSGEQVRNARSYLTRSLFLENRGLDNEDYLLWVLNDPGECWLQHVDGGVRKISRRTWA